MNAFNEQGTLHLAKSGETPCGAGVVMRRNSLTLNAAGSMLQCVRLSWLARPCCVSPSRSFFSLLWVALLRRDRRWRVAVIGWLIPKRWLSPQGWMTPGERRTRRRYRGPAMDLFASSHRRGRFLRRPPQRPNLFTGNWRGSIAIPGTILRCGLALLPSLILFCPAEIR